MQQLSGFRGMQRRCRVYHIQMYERTTSICSFQKHCTIEGGCPQRQNIEERIFGIFYGALYQGPSFAVTAKLCQLNP